MSDLVDGTRGQSPEEVRGLPSAPRPVFAAGEAVPGLSSWVLERKLGGGGFGEVWLAKHVWDNEQKPRAVKFCTDPAAKNRLVTHERNVVVRVMKYAGKHPNIVPLLDCNLDGDIPWLMYEFVEGGTLADAMKEWRELPLPKRLGRAVRVLHAIAGALGTFHRFDPPLVHRDMKPHNVLMAGPVPRITDFGIGGVAIEPKNDGTTGALTAYAARLPSALHAAGTARYAPPEQRFGSAPNPRDDVYALGIIAYQMVMADLMGVPGTDASQELRDLKVPGELVSLIVTSVAMNSDRRPKDATEWEARLATLLQKSQKQQEPEPKAFGKRKVLALALGGVLILGLAIAIVIAAIPSGKRSESTAPTERIEKPTNDPEGGAPLTNGGGTKGGSPEPKVVLPKAGDTREIEIALGMKMTFCWIPKGECRLGSPRDEQDYVTKTFFEGKRPDWLDSETEARRGTFKTDGFWLGKYTVTQAEWKAVMGDNPSFFRVGGEGASKLGAITDTSRFPVGTVSWDRICGQGKYVGTGFLNTIDHSVIQKALGKPGKFRLPKEDEWEYAARVGRGNEQPFYWGKELNGTQANCDGNNPYGALPKGTYLGRTCAVDATGDTMGHEYAPHPWGLMHLHGNVWQWCEDYYDKANILRVLRGGSWGYHARFCRAAYRGGRAPDDDDDVIGFRLVVPGLP